MYNLNGITPRFNFTCWFTRQRLNMYLWSIIDSDGAKIGTIDQINNTVNFTVELPPYTPEDVKAQFEIFKANRPEYLVGNSISDDTINSPECAIATMNNIITGIMLLQYADDETAIKNAERCLNWLHSTDFYKCPGSIKYHDAEPTGLLKHTLRVINRILELLTLPAFYSVNTTEAVLVAIVHDWCKIGTYEEYLRNVKNETTGVWEKVPSYRHLNSPIPFGHGTTSMFIAQRFFKLSMEQALAIRWHMGAGSVADFENSDFWDANEKYPLVSMIQFADRLSIMKV